MAARPCGSVDAHGSRVDDRWRRAGGPRHSSPFAAASRANPSRQSAMPPPSPIVENDRSPAAKRARAPLSSPARRAVSPRSFERTGVVERSLLEVGERLGAVLLGRVEVARTERQLAEAQRRTSTRPGGGAPLRVPSRGGQVVPVELDLGEVGERRGPPVRALGPASTAVSSSSARPRDRGRPRSARSRPLRREPPPDRARRAGPAGRAPSRPTHGPLPSGRAR